MFGSNTAVVNQLSSRRSDYVSYLRQLSNPRVKFETLVNGLTSHCGEASRGRSVPAIGDTTDINHNRHAGRIQPGELGPGADGSGLGYLMHPMLVLEEESRLPLGFGDIKLWTRDPKALRYNEKEARKLPTEQKESFRWIERARRRPSRTLPQRSTSLSSSTVRPTSTS